MTIRDEFGKCKKRQQFFKNVHLFLLIPHAEKMGKQMLFISSSCSEQLKSYFGSKNGKK